MGELRQRADQQDAVTAFGRFALESREIAATIERALDLVAETLDAPIVLLLRLWHGPGRVSVVRSRGLAEVVEGQEFEVSEELFATYDVTEPLHVGDWRTEERFPRPATEFALTSSLGASVLVGGRPWGRLVMVDTQARTFTAAELGFAQSMAHLLATALERDRSERAQAAVADFGRFALRSRDITATIQRAVDLVMATLETPMASLLRVSGPRRVTVLCSRGVPGLVDGDVEVPDGFAAAQREPGPVVVRDWRSETRFPQAPSATANGVLASIAVGVLVAGQPCRLGVMDTRPRQFGDFEVDFVQAIAHLLASAMERDRMETRLRETTRQLQQALLPATLPELDGVELAARYVPAGGDQVGGDWYDVLALPHGGVALVMGDVEGHDSTAAAVMGQVRNVLRTYAGEGLVPAELMARVNQFVSGHTDRLVTCCYCELRAEERTLTYTSAGHPAPLVLQADGALSPVPLLPGLLLGVNGGASYSQRTVLLPGQCCLLLVTDGLIDDVAGVLPGQQALASAAHSVVDLPIDVLADRLVARPSDAPGLPDDAALLAVRLTSPNCARIDSASRGFAPHPAATPAARHFAADVLVGWGLRGLREAALLAVSELVTNAVVHTTSTVHLTLRRLGSGGLWIGVRDDSDRIPQPRSPSTANGPDFVDLGGRGLAIVGRLADDWGVAPVPGRSGKTVWLELSGRPAP